MITSNEYLGAHAHSSGHFQWGSIFAGTAIALALSLVLMQFGSAVGLADDAPLRGEGSLASWGIIATGIWLLWVQLLASLSGGYAAGYLRAPTPDCTPHENELKDGLYGLVVWATSTVLVFIGVGLAAAVASYIAIATDSYEDPSTITDPEQNAAVIFAFVAGATSLLSAVAAWWAATMGGEHRGKGVDFTGALSFRKK
ncbi:MAG: hypothetical protein KKA05_08695 [Alphaproteobacteria bacterium]|nr:hypothetical protein [Alphaproteobacteria bacterium]